MYLILPRTQGLLWAGSTVNDEAQDKWSFRKNFSPWAKFKIYNDKHLLLPKERKIVYWIQYIFKKLIRRYGSKRILPKDCPWKGSRRNTALASCVYLSKNSRGVLGDSFGVYCKICFMHKSIVVNCIFNLCWTIFQW